MNWLIMFSVYTAGIMFGVMLTSLLVASKEKGVSSMPTMYDDVDARCPFFRYSDKRKISCEGITDGCSINIEFDCHAKRDLHRSIFCNAKYQNCEIYMMLEEKYEDE